MMIYGSTPFSFAMASICCSNGLTVGIIQLSGLGLQLSGSFLEFNRQLCAFDARERNAVRLASFLEHHIAVLDGYDPPRER